MRIVRIIILRLGSALLSLIFATFVVFMLQRLIPGDTALAIAGEYANDELIAQIRDELGLNLPLWEQYLRWAGNALTGDLGQSLYSHDAILPIILDRLPLTLLLTFFALVFAVLVGVPTGVWAAKHEGGRLDRLVVTIATLGLAIPSYWLGMMLIVLFANTLRILPGPGGPALADDPAAALLGLVMPAIALGVVGAGEICRQLRSAMIEDLSSDHIRTLWAKGLPSGQVVWKHSLKNSGLPLATIIGLQVSRLIGGAVIIEAVFGLAGIGGLIVQATEQRDYTVVQGVVLVTAIIVLVTNLLVDIAYRYIDPRID